jgi:hypothetical protein
MNKFCIALLAVLSIGTMTAGQARSADKLTVKEWVDTFVDLCVGAGSTFIASGSGDVSAGLSLQTRTLSGEVKGQLLLSKSEYRLLSEGISNKMTSVSADQANRVRDCLDPIRRNLIVLMSAQMGATTNGAPQKVFILSADEEVLIRALCTVKGTGGELGQFVNPEDLKAVAHLPDIRFRISTNGS